MMMVEDWGFDYAAMRAQYRADNAIVHHYMFSSTQDDVGAREAPVGRVRGRRVHAVSADV